MFILDYGIMHFNIYFLQITQLCIKVVLNNVSFYYNYKQQKYFLKLLCRYFCTDHILVHTHMGVLSLTHSFTHSPIGTYLCTHIHTSVSSDEFKKYSTTTIKRKQKFGKTSEMMERFYFVISVTGLSKPNPGKHDDNDDNDDDIYKSC
jgi:hypothetical protein